jgi:hypothetical protein
VFIKTLVESSLSEVLPYSRNGSPSLVATFERPCDVCKLLGARWYQPGAGRFWSRDPIGYRGGLNLYGYVKENPINYIDPSGYDMSLYGQINPGVHPSPPETYWSPPSCYKHDFWGCFGKCIEDNDPLDLLSKGLLSGAGGSIPKQWAQIVADRLGIPLRTGGIGGNVNPYTSLPSIISQLRHGGYGAWLRIFGRGANFLWFAYGDYMACVEANCASICAGYTGASK